MMLGGRQEAVPEEWGGAAERQGVQGDGSTAEVLAMLRRKRLQNYFPRVFALPLLRQHLNSRVTLACCNASASRGHATACADDWGACSTRRAASASWLTFTNASCADLPSSLHCLRTPAFTGGRAGALKWWAGGVQQLCRHMARWVGGTTEKKGRRCERPRGRDRHLKWRLV